MAVLQQPIAAPDLKIEVFWQWDGEQWLNIKIIAFSQAHSIYQQGSRICQQGIDLIQNDKADQGIDQCAKHNQPEGKQSHLAQRQPGTQGHQAVSRMT